MEIKINIKTKEYLIKTPRSVDSSTSMRMPLPSQYVGKSMLFIPIIDDDLILIRERDYGYYISICGLEMFNKTVQPYFKDRPSKGGKVYLPNKWVGCEFLIIPLEDTENEKYLYDDE